MLQIDRFGKLFLNYYWQENGSLYGSKKIVDGLFLKDSADVNNFIVDYHIGLIDVDICIGFKYLVND